jgi:hypothetical protein
MGRLLLVNHHHLNFAFSRSEIYSAGLAFLHVRSVLWPIVALQAWFTAWMIWLLVRVLAQGRLALYLSLSLILAAASGLAWYVAFVMPDILGSLLCLTFFLLVVARHHLRRWETVFLSTVACFSITAHATHLLLAIALCLLFAILCRARWFGLGNSGRNVMLIFALTLAAASAQYAVHFILYGRATLFGNAPPFVMARLISDGPARLYLQNHCNSFGGPLCRNPQTLPTNEKDFLWSPAGVWQTAIPAERAELQREQMPLLFNTLRTYPLQQIAKSADNVLQTLLVAGPDDFWNVSSVFTPASLDFAARGLAATYPSTAEAHDLLPQKPFRLPQAALTAISALILVVFLGRRTRRKDAELQCFALVVLFFVFTNAVISGVISGLDPRYGGRMAWLLPLGAGLVVRILSSRRTTALPNQRATHTPG